LAGANLVGGCCGTTPEHINALSKNISRRKPLEIRRYSLSALSSARKTVILEGARPLCVIGERINPTGKKVFQEELRQGKLAFVRQAAQEQARAGAELLDVNVGAPGIDESKMMVEAIELLSTLTDCPLVIDSADPAVIERALRVYPGRALINSISAEKKRLSRLMPLAAKYGAMFIVLPLTDKGVPGSFDLCKEIIKQIIARAKECGISCANAVVDGLAMTVSSDILGPRKTLEVIDWCARSLKCNCTMGISNISFGMPERKWINAAFLAMACSKGLSLVIANPSSPEFMNIKMASDVLNGHDKDCQAYIDYWKIHVAGQSAVKPAEKTVEQKVLDAVMDGNREQINDFIKEALSSGLPAEKIVQELMIPAITKVGELFERKEYFLPQLIASAEAMKKGMDALAPHLGRDGIGADKPVAVVLATVEGDIHDIGKNIVALMLKNHGFFVIDLGKDVSAVRIIAAIKKHKPSVVGLSALMTTTMVKMKDVISLAKKEGLSCRFIVGGAAVTKFYADSLGVEYAKDGVDAVRFGEQYGKN